MAGICSADAVHLLAACSGGILASLTAAVLTDRSRAAAAAGAADDNPRLASLTLLVTMLDQARTDAVGAFVDESTAQAAIAASARKGYLDGRRLAELFAWLRPGDLIWNYWVNNYLLGREPARFDILFWNADTTRMTAGLHRDFVRAAVANALASPGGLTVLGTEIDLSQVDLDSYVVAGVADHICPWQSCYRGAQLLGGKTRFVLSSSGHIAALVNPAGNKKSGYQVSNDVTADAESWQRAAPPSGDRGGRTTPAGWGHGPAARSRRRASSATSATGHRARPGQLRARRMRGRQADRVTMVTVGDGRRLRVAIRPGTGGWPARCSCATASAPPSRRSRRSPASWIPRSRWCGSTCPEWVARRCHGCPIPSSALARLAARMLGELGYDRFDAFGISWGGGLAQQLALQYPRRCRRLVLAATSTGSLMIPASPRVLRHLSSPRRHRDPAHAARIAGTIYGGALRDHPELAEPITLALPRPVSRRGYLYQLTASAGWTSLPVLRLIRQPTLILAGDDDPIIPLANAQADGRAAARRPAARLSGRSPRPAHQGRRARPRGQRFPAPR